MEYAKSLIERKAGKNAAAAERAATSGSDGDVDDDAEEESWTFIGDEAGPLSDDDLDLDTVMKRSQLLGAFPDAARSQVLGGKVLRSTNTMLYTGQRSPGPRRSISNGSAQDTDTGR